MADPVKSEKFNVPPLVGLVMANPHIEPSAEEAEALPLLLDGVENYPEWTYSDSSEDNGTAGILDLEAGLVYNGPQGMYVQVSIRDLDLSAAHLGSGVGAPEATDTMELAVYVNSVLAGSSDEGNVAELDSEIVEYNLDRLVGPLNESDVLRVVIRNVGEEADADTQLDDSAIITIR